MTAPPIPYAEISKSLSCVGVPARMNKVSFKRISGFIAAGGMATLFHWAAMSGLILLGMEPVGATFSGSVVGAVAVAAFNYVVYQRLVFHEQTS